MFQIEGSVYVVHDGFMLQGFADETRQRTANERTAKLSKIIYKFPIDIMMYEVTTELVQWKQLIIQE